MSNNFRDYFMCDNCTNTTFKRVYTFSLRFHKVNFSEKLLYDKVIDETYQCTKCNKTFTREQIEEGLTELKKKRGK
jgi:ribosomal protein L37AE/L43A